MASVGSLTVEIAANIASLRTGIEEANSRVASMEKQMAKTSAKMQSSFEGSIAGIRTAWIAGSAAIYSSISTISKAWELANIAASYEEQKGYLDNLSSKYQTTADSMVKSMEEASNHLISKTALMQISLEGLSKNMSPDQMINLAKAATLLGDTVGVDATTALNDLSSALETGRAKALKQYTGTALDLELTFGDLTKKMTDAEKAQAMYALTMLYANKIQSEQKKEISDTADKFEQLTAKYENLKLEAGYFSKAILVAATDNLTFSNTLDISGEKMGNYTVDILKGSSAILTLIQLYKMLKVAREESEPQSTYGKSNIATTQVTPPTEDANKEFNEQIANLKKLLAARKDIENAGKGAISSHKAIQEGKLRISEEISNREIAIVKATESDKLIEMSKTFELEKKQMLDKRAMLQDEVSNLVRLKGSNQEILKVKGDIALLDEQMKTKQQTYAIEYDQEKYKIQLSDMKTFNDNKLKILDESVSRENDIIKSTEDSKTNQLNRIFQLEKVFINDSLQSKASQIQKMLELENDYNDAVRAERLKAINETYENERVLLETNRANLEAQLPVLENIKGSHDEILKVKNDIALLDSQIYSLEQSYITDVLDVQDSKLNDILSKYISLNEQAQGLMQNIANTAIMNAPGGGDIASLMGAVSELDALQANMDAQKEIYQKALDEIVGMDEKAQARRQAINTLATRNITAMEKSATLQKVNIAAMGFNSMAQLAKAFYDASGQQSENAFKAYKALMYATTVVSTAAGIMKIWAEDDGPWYYKAALSAMVAAAGAAQLATIANASPGSAATVTTPSGTAPVVATTGTQSATATGTPASKEITVNINIMGNVLDKDAFAREIVPSIRKAISDNV